MKLTMRTVVLLLICCTATSVGDEPSAWPDLPSAAKSHQLAASLEQRKQEADKAELQQSLSDLKSYLAKEIFLRSDEGGYSWGATWYHLGESIFHNDGERLVLSNPGCRETIVRELRAAGYQVEERCGVTDNSYSLTIRW